MPTGSRYSNPKGIRVEGSDSFTETWSEEKTAFRFSTTKRAYLKKSKRARLLKMLMSSQILRLLNRAPSAINNRNKRNGQVWKSIVDQPALVHPHRHSITSFYRSMTEVLPWWLAGRSESRSNR